MPGGILGSHGELTSGLGRQPTDWLAGRAKVVDLTDHQLQAALARSLLRRGQPGLVVLPAHDRTAAQRLLDS